MNTLRSSRAALPAAALALALAIALALAAHAHPGAARAAEPPPSPDSPGFALYVMTRVDDLYRGVKSHGIMEMEVKTRHWSRTLELESWSLGTEYSLVRILAPKKEAGTATLKAKADLFTYLSKTGRTVKITSGMMGGSWMGSHFTNDDLVQTSRLSHDFVIAKTFDGDLAGVPVYTFTLTAKPDAAIVWGKIDVTVRKADLEPLTELFYDESGHQVRKMEFSDYRDVGGIVRPANMILTPLDGSGEYTRITWKKIEHDVSLDPGFFTLLKLKSM